MQCPVLGSPIHERHGHIGASPAKSHGDAYELESLSHVERLRYLGLFNLQAQHLGLFNVCRCLMERIKKHRQPQEASLKYKKELVYCECG